jgi:hypothetical protein
MKKKQLITEAKRLQELAGLLKEDARIDKEGNIIYSLSDENSEWDFSDMDTFAVKWYLDNDVSDKDIQNKFEWDDDEFKIEIPIKDIQDFVKDPTKNVQNFQVSGGYLPITKQQANDIIESYYENWPDEINPDLN